MAIAVEATIVGRFKGIGDLQDFTANGLHESTGGSANWSKVDSEPSIMSKIEADRRRNPEEYMQFFEDCLLLPNENIGHEGRF